jgi:flagellin-like hook-associated protein FlgL
MKKSLRMLALMLAALLVLAACAPAEQEETDPVAQPQAEETPADDPGMEDHSDDAAPAADLGAADVRITLERQLGAHAVLAIEAMRKGHDGAPDFEAAAAALDQNTQDLTSTIELVYGADAGQAFRSQWEEHIGFFVNYTVGLAEGDEQAQGDALAQLEQYRDDFAGFLSEATEGEVPADGAAEALQAHVDQLVAQIDAYAAGDLETAYTQEREAHRHMFMTAQVLAGGIVAQHGDQFPGDADAGAVQLRSDLGMLLSEHGHLAVVAMRRGLQGAEDFEAAAGSLDANTQDLTAAIESVYGADAAQAFQAQWDEHIGFFVNYTVGLAEGDEQAQSDARAQLEQYREDFAAFLEGATEGEVPAGAAADALQMHVDQLITQIDAFAGEDWDTAHATAYEAYDHMYDTAEALAGGIAAQMPEQFPASDA